MEKLDEKHHYLSLYRLQKKELFDDQEQADNSRQTGNEEVLSLLPEAYGSQRDKVVWRVEGRKKEGGQ